MICRCLFALVAVVLTSSSARADALRLDDQLLQDAWRTAATSMPSDGALVSAVPWSLLDVAPAAANAPPPPAQLSNLGVGLQLGFPTALTLKLGAAQRDGFVFGLGAGFGYSAFLPWISLTGEYQLHLVTLVANPTLSLTGYFAPGLWLALQPGSGGYFGFYNRPYFVNFPLSLGVRGTFGLSLLFAQAPVEVYLELTPAIFVFPGFDPGVGWSLGFRYYF